MNKGIVLRNVEELDLPVFFEHQRDPVASYMAAFTAKDPTDKEAFTDRWLKILADNSIIKKSILYESQVVGHLVSFEQSGRREIGYWIDPAFWGQGIATAALSQFLFDVDTRPLRARAAIDNVASIRVLEKCGFKKVGRDKGYANARGQIVEEFIFELG